jgi:TRAP-type C4-dicarboxylate transport system permease small subunit
MRPLLKYAKLPGDVLMWVALFAGFLMMAHTMIDVIGRTVFNHPLAGTTEIVSGYYMVAVAFLPWAWVSQNNGHILVELFTRGLNARQIARLDAGVSILTAFYVAIFTWQTFVGAQQATELQETWQAGVHFLPIWPSRWLLPLGGTCMVFYLVLRAVSDITGGREPKAETELLGGK